jgi:hypothetical protein
MPSLFDALGDEEIKLPEPKPPLNWKKILTIGGLATGLVAVVVGGWIAWQILFPPPLTKRPIPPSPDRLMTELREARDDIDSKTRDVYARIQQFNQRMETLGRRPVSFSQVFLQGLSTEEEAALDELVKNEKDPSYRGVLGQVVEDMKKIRDLQHRVGDLEAKLPGDGIDAKPGDSHQKLAEDWLIKEHKVPPTRAKELAERLNLMYDRLEKGMKVYFYYDPAKDFFGTWVTQSDARHAPLAITRAREMKLMGERDTAVAMAKDLQEKKEELEETLAKLEKDVAALEARKASLETNVAQLEADKTAAIQKAEKTSADFEEHKNSLFYEADLAERLRARGVLRTFDRVEAIADVKFQNSIDLTKEKSITLKPSQFGIPRIRDVRIVPAFLKEGRDIGVKYDEDGTVEVTVLDDKALRGQKVLFIVRQ